MSVTSRNQDLVCITAVNIGGKGESKPNRDNTMNFYCFLEVVALFFALSPLYFAFSVVQFLLDSHFILQLLSLESSEEREI